MYGFSCHPMYLGFVLVLMGVVIQLASLIPWAMVPIFAAPIEVAFIRVEEHMLEEIFGPIWQAYKNKVRRWIKNSEIRFWPYFIPTAG